jgi:hypothetical protein
MTLSQGLLSEAETRARLIDRSRTAAGWPVQDRAASDLTAGRGVAIREFPLTTGFADYLLFVDRKAAGATPWTGRLWIYDLRTNEDFSLKQKPLTRGDLDDFVGCYNPANRHDRTPTWSDESPAGRWRSSTYDELIARDKVNLNIFWLRDESLEDSANLPEPDVIAREIVEDLQAALEQFAAIAEDLGE